MINTKEKQRWLVTGAAGFIGVNLAEHLLRAGHVVRGVDNFITGKKSRLEYLKNSLPQEKWNNFEFIEGDLLDKDVCHEVCNGVTLISHQAALGSVPRSIKDPINSHRNNVDAFINLLFAAKESRVKRFVYASSSSVYGDNPTLPKIEDKIGRALSPYAATKQIDELYANIFSKTYGIETVGLRYFNVFGPCQDPEGPYAAVIPLWVRSLFKGETVYINGDGLNSRDFCFVDNVVSANVLAALSPSSAANTAYNIACGDQLNLLDLFKILKQEATKVMPEASNARVEHRPPREGDIPHSLADISKARENLTYMPLIRATEGLAKTVTWYSKNSFLFK